MSLKPLLKPKSVAIVGASPTPGKIGHVLVENLKQFGGKVFYVNPHHKLINKQKCYKNVNSINSKVDLAVFAIPAPLIPDALKAASKAKTVLIISSGFSEVGNNKLSKKIKNILIKNKQRLLGPNCLGLQIPRFKLNITFVSTMAKPGNIAFISQSGGFCGAMLDWAQLEKIGFSAFISIGNMEDLDFADFIHHFNKDSNTKAIVLYMEGLKDGKKFLAAAKSCKKPIIVFKVGKTKEGIASAATHTGSLAGEYAIYKGAFKQGRIIEATSTQELFDLTKAFSLTDRPKTNKTIIITNSGGTGTAAADVLPKNLDLIEKVIDLTGNATEKTFKQIFKKYEKTNANFMVTFLPTALTNPEKIAKEIVNFAKKKTVLASFPGGKNVVGCNTILKEYKIARFDTPEQAINALSKLVR